MKSSEIYRVIDEVAKTSSPKAKVAILTKYASCPHLAEVLGRTYNPFITYGITVEHGSCGGGSYDFAEDTLQLLDDLRSRRLTGHAARDAINTELNSLNAESAELLVRIINGDMRAGISTSTINKVFPKLIPELPYMRCSLPKHVKVEDFDWSEGVYSQLKADGMFANCEHTERGEVRFTSRQGQAIPVTSLYGSVRKFLRPGTVSMGELLVTKDGKVLPRKDGNGLINSLAENPSALEGYAVEYHVWDQIPAKDFVVGGVCDTKYMVRYANVFAQLGNAVAPDLKVIPTRIVHSYKEARTHALEFQRLGLEGTVYKDPHAPWADGTSKWQVKVKVEFVVDLKIVGYTQGKGKRAKDFGALVCETADGLLRTDVAGLKDGDYARINADRDGYLETIVAVSANDLSEVGGKACLMHPRVAEFRKDKVVADTLQQVRDQLEAARNGG